MNHIIEQLRKVAELTPEQKAKARRDAAWENDLFRLIEARRDEVERLAERMSKLVESERPVVAMFACHVLIQYALRYRRLPAPPGELDAMNRALGRLAEQCIEFNEQEVRRGRG
jgi:hypothetical protein